MRRVRPGCAGASDTASVSDRFFRQLVLQHAERRAGHHARRPAGGDERGGVPHPRPRAPPGRRSGSRISEVLRDQPDILRILAAAFDLQHLPNRAELRLKGSGKVIGYTLSHILDEHGRPEGAALFFKDLTLVEQLEERERLRDRLAALGEMAAAIAHEVKNPLAGIEVMAGLLRRQHPGLARRAGAAQRHHQRGEDRQRDRRSRCSSSSGRSACRSSGPSIAQVLHDAVTLAERQGEPRRRGGDDEHPGAAAADPGGSPPAVPAVQQPADQRPRGARRQRARSRSRRRQGVAVPGAGGRASADPPAPTVVVEVADDGPGVPPDILERVFNPFFTTKPQGSGLGLAIVRKIVDAHDGHIDLVSGSAGHAVPGDAPAQQRRGVAPVERIARGTAMGRILIADDHDALRRGLVRALTEAGHDVDEAPNGNAAIERLHDGYFDVVLTRPEDGRQRRPGRAAHDARRCTARPRSS